MCVYTTQLAQNIGIVTVCGCRSSCFYTLLAHKQQQLQNNNASTSAILCSHDVDFHVVELMLAFG